jgi:hypothetical protein
MPGIAETSRLKERTYVKQEAGTEGEKTDE